MSKYYSMLAVLTALYLSGCGSSNSTPVAGDNNTSADTTAPVFTSADAASVNENQTSAITLIATDDATITYSLSGIDSDSFDVDSSTGVVTFKVAPDFETKSAYTFTATATDESNNVATQDVIITIDDVDETVPDTTAPVFTSANAASVNENQTSAITLEATDAISVPTFTISGTDSASFDVNSTTGVVTFKVAPDFETKASYEFTATASDAAGNSSEQPVTITIMDVYEEVFFVKKTGQTKSYDENGTEVTDGSIKDDGDYRYGAVPEYTNASDIVTDELTGLMWQDNAAVQATTKPWLSADNNTTCSADPTSSACDDTSGDTAATYCQDLNLGGYTDWRIPTLTELQVILDYSKVNNAINSTFNNVRATSWSSTSFAGSNDKAWIVQFNNGGSTAPSKGLIYGVRCVREQ